MRIESMLRNKNHKALVAVVVIRYHNLQLYNLRLCYVGQRWNKKSNNVSVIQIGSRKLVFRYVRATRLDNDGWHCQSLFRRYFVGRHSRLDMYILCTFVVVYNLCVSCRKQRVGIRGKIISRNKVE